MPNAPTIGTATTTGSTTATVTFTAAGSGPAATNFFITSSPVIGSGSSATSPISVTGLAASTQYTFTVTASNAAGNSSPSASSNQITTNAATFTCDFLVIAGGGGGGGFGGGGGAGGLRSTIGNTGGGGDLETALQLSQSTNYAVYIGAGGTAGNGTSYTRGGQGGSTIFSTITSTGGGGGGSQDFTGGNGGSSGGGGQNPTYRAPGTRTASPVQGYSGGYGYTTQDPYYTSGGGGGSGGLGGDAIASTTVNAAGGVGLAISITGSSVTYGTGGGALGAGANNQGNGANGATNKGDGAQGGSNVMMGGVGGSGVIILRYSDARTISFGAGVTGTESGASGGYKRATITAGDGNVSWT